MSLLTQLRAFLVPTVLMVGLSACGSSDWFGDSEEPPLPGERISVLRMEKDLTPDPELARVSVRLPAPSVNGFWPGQDGYASHAMGHLALPSDLDVAWRADIGSGGDETDRLLTRPVVAGGLVFTMDTSMEVSAFDEQTGSRRWSTTARAENEDGQAWGGGLAFDRATLFVTTGYGEVLALDSKNGAILWRKSFSAPIRSAPTIDEGRIFFVTLDNQMYALSFDNGDVLWRHRGILEAAGLIGAAAPAVDSGVTIVPYSSGELFALRSGNGRMVWSESLGAIRRSAGIGHLSDIRGAPVIDRGLVLAISHSGRMVAIDVRTGGRVWEQNIGSLYTPWVAGDYIFVLTNDGEMVALTRQSGRIHWVTKLPRYEDEEENEGLILWAGPVLAGDRIWAVGSNGQVMSLNPQNGDFVGDFDVRDPISLPPVVANQTLFVLTDDGMLYAYR